jgi:DNA repair exonuclease SbcCD nuclease subunit
MRFLHTSDWQLGLKLNFVPGEAGARLRAQRFDTVRRIAEVGRERKVDAVVVAGDVFDDNGVGPDTIQQARDALAVFAPLPVLLLPGNHDPADSASALAQLAASPHVRVLSDQTPVATADGIFFPCPLLQRHTREDPTAGLPPRGPGESAVRVAIAHGGVLDFSETTETPNRIDVPRLLAKGFDYLALGDWHGTLRFDARAWYSGTPEPTRFTEQRPGNVLLVTIPAAGETPEVEPIPVGRARWLSHEMRFYADSDVTGLAAWFDAPTFERSWTLVSLALDGHLSLSGRASLDLLLETERGRFLHLDVSRDAVVDAPSDEDLHVLTAEGFVGIAANALRLEGTPEARGALRLLHRMLLQGGR